MARRNPQPTVLPAPRPASPPDDGDEALVAWLGERVRRVALGLSAALITARAYWPGEPDFKFEAGGGLVWDLAVLIALGLALASCMIDGTLRIRWSWTDAAVVALMLLVGLSATQAHARRPAINLAWDWGAIGALYLIVRNLPRTAGESKVLIGALVATAVALSAYGLYQTGVELPRMRADFNAHEAERLTMIGIRPGSPAAKLYRDRLLGSNEVMSTFALSNSLAGFLIGPLVVMLAFAREELLGRDRRRSRLSGVVLASAPMLVVLVCLLLTKSRSGYIGLAVGAAVLAWQARRRVNRRTLAVGVLGGAAVLGGLVAFGITSGRLDREVLTESTKSLRYRREYWVGAWRVITENNQVFWMGHGPGNFGAPYLKHKLPEASEEISDPHNLFLDVWATAGAPAAAALAAALVLGFINLLGPARGPAEKGAPGEDEAGPPSRRPEPSDPPRRAGWLLACGGGGWLVVALLGQLNPFEGDLFYRWLILGGAWLWAILFGLPLWRRQPIAASTLGAAAVAVTVNLLAAGGIGFAPVALMLWVLIALGLNLREDRGCGRLRDAGGRLLMFGLAVAWAALVGSFYGAAAPFWESEALIAQAEGALHARPPRFDKADEAYRRASMTDHYSARPWLGQAFEKYEEWRARGAKVDDLRWKAIGVALTKAVMAPRNPDSWSLHSERAAVTLDLIAQIGSRLKPYDLITLRGNVVEATRNASLLYPTNASLHARLAEASAEMGLFGDAAREAREALRLDGLTPHLDKKLAPTLIAHLNAELPRWDKLARANPGLNIPAR